MKTLPLTARAPRPFTPFTLQDRYNKALDAWDRKRTAREDILRANEGQPDALRVPPPPEPGQKPELPVFMIAVPTALERAQSGSLMFELGVYPISRETVRNVVLEECFTLYGDDAGDELASFLDNFWTLQNVADQDMAIWAEQERQRVLDEMETGKVREPTALPRPRNPTKDRIRAQREVDRIMETSATARRIVAKQQDFNRLNGVMMIRTHLRGWSGLRTQREAIHPGSSGSPPVEILTEACADALLEEIGDTAWQELINEIDSQYGLSREEVGNFDSRLDTAQTADGSPEGSDAKAENPSGVSPGAPTEPTN